MDKVGSGSLNSCETSPGDEILPDPG